MKEKVKIENEIFHKKHSGKNLWLTHDPEKNNFKLSLWENSKSKEIKKYHF